ncbi:MAG TPA: hemerythrin domain-containing protein [Aminivibrio sp.]|uniref:hemerythrin domain-containing protein n=1 Tax=Aminivibrio sp. TaxID=1872489 RepID=UPI002B1EBCB1|nr:hemerythrin domain-containing protein [Aminivibrio sp.]MEA4953120.1 hemerythrin domain-containing protein [Aminivibrio sp.]HPF84238.1 hemerythrin domain-containing protein [Aminivibrio sp.]
MKSTDELRNEHRGIEVMLDILDGAAEKLSGGAPADFGHLDGMMEFLSVFADTCHHGKEEDFLFPGLEAAGIPNEGGPIGVMLGEHRKGREHIAGMKRGITAMKAGDRGGVSMFAENAAGYTALLRQHIQKEDNVLFVMAEQRLDAAKDEELFREFEKLEEERIGKGKHDEFHALLDRLQKIYTR